MKKFIASFMILSSIVFLGACTNSKITKTFDVDGDTVTVTLDAKNQTAEIKMETLRNEDQQAKLFNTTEALAKFTCPTLAKSLFDTSSTTSADLFSNEELQEIINNNTTTKLTIEFTNKETQKAEYRCVATSSDSITYTDLTE